MKVEDPVTRVVVDKQYGEVRKILARREARKSARCLPRTMDLVSRRPCGCNKGLELASIDRITLTERGQRAHELHGGIHVTADNKKLNDLASKSKSPQVGVLGDVKRNDLLEKRKATRDLPGAPIRSSAAHLPCWATSARMPIT